MAANTQSASVTIVDDDVRQLIISGDCSAYDEYWLAHGSTFVEVACKFFADLVDIICSPKTKTTNDHRFILWSLINYITSTDFKGDRALIKTAVLTAAHYDHTQAAGVILDKLGVDEITFQDYFTPSDFVVHASKGNIKVMEMLYMCHPEIRTGSHMAEALDKLPEPARSKFDKWSKNCVKYKCNDYLGILSQRIRIQEYVGN
jgi:hypothetical protein